MRMLPGMVASLLAVGPVGALAQAPDGQGSCPPGQRCTPLRDPVLGMDAFLVAAPPGWHTQGAVVYGSSPDGLTILERLPRMDWRWGKFAPKSPQQGCLPLREEISPADFLQTLSSMMGVE